MDPNALKSRSPSTLPAWWEATHRLPTQEVELPRWERTALPRLSQVERATVRVSAPLLSLVPLGRSILHEAQFRLALFTPQVLLHMSGHDVARHLQQTPLQSWHPMARRYAKRGWVLLAELDRADIGTEVWLATPPSSTNGVGRWRHVRLAARLAELAPVRG